MDEFKDGPLETCRLRLVGDTGIVSNSISNTGNDGNRSGIYLVTDDGRIVEGVSRIKVHAFMDDFMRVVVEFTDIPIELGPRSESVRKIRIQNDQVSCRHTKCTEITRRIGSITREFQCLKCGLDFVTDQPNPDYQPPEPRDWDDEEIPF